MRVWKVFKSFFCCFWMQFQSRRVLSRGFNRAEANRTKELRFGLLYENVQWFFLRIFQDFHRIIFQVFWKMSEFFDFSEKFPGLSKEFPGFFENCPRLFEFFENFLTVFQVFQRTVRVVLVFQEISRVSQVFSRVFREFWPKKSRKKLRNFLTNLLTVSYSQTIWTKLYQTEPRFLGSVQFESLISEYFKKFFKTIKFALRSWTLFFHPCRLPLTSDYDRIKNFYP